jgi:hypothetical protein
MEADLHAIVSLQFPNTASMERTEVRIVEPCTNRVLYQIRSGQPLSDAHFQASLDSIWT